MLKTVQTRSFFWSIFSSIQAEYRKMWIRKNSVFGHFLRSVNYAENNEISPKVWCESFVETHSFQKVSGDLPETL